MKKNQILITACLSFTALAFGLIYSTPQVAAQTNATGQGLEIAPPVITLTADPGQTINTKISLRDVSGGDLVVTGQINDFVASGEGGAPKVLLEETDKSPYSIKDWISPLPELTLKPKQIENLPVTITVPTNAAPGGYYGVIRFTATPPELKDTGVSLSASLGALILLRVNGDVKEELSIEEFFVSKNGGKGTLFETAPLQFSERLKNDGTIHEKPSGLVTITDMFGNKTATLGINQPPTNILPGSIRKYDQTLDSSVIGNKILFGLYTADLSITYGANNTVLNQKITFWVIPYTLIGATIAALIIAFLGLRYAIKRYNKHIRDQVLGTTKKSKK
ncbi:hypothetical protein COV88_00170 [Candidatus Saccharibacteria bacterium CG11_big_fil_rev_8_21_14_0_20_41_19]|nr:hypothetical protein [Candidatus Saccharibacteria bacterium]OIP85419.1 MAG: hypothetical protein AUK57_03840 [Candidatus Saccharibacteria bacterium CG2_30_41_52]PIQ71198.1 MAG: hypothetical protein COV88_00170 [Candidatus Saccharibacteria bacterium CG11_big_fil_rev_8_21_14_0_20_41_19]PIZ59855.1 MAG: hypothetical protein COY18_02705 [Candidatus Saccharibacteria bacterium CG_4_10_14_0_2_um_filter_41_11]PJC29954.1 MAG: hypothetical protein CO052_00615 [Candidatus Saccharibacteria bacterium CG_4